MYISKKVKYIVGEIGPCLWGQLEQSFILQILL